MNRPFVPYMALGVLLALGGLCTCAVISAYAERDAPAETAPR